MFRMYVYGSDYIRRSFNVFISTIHTVFYKNIVFLDLYTDTSYENMFREEGGGRRVEYELDKRSLGFPRISKSHQQISPRDWNKGDFAAVNGRRI